MADQYSLNSDDVVLALAKDLKTEGWDVSASWGRPDAFTPAEVWTVRWSAKGSTEQNEARSGMTVIPLAGRHEFKALSQQELDTYQTLFGGGA